VTALIGVSSSQAFYLDSERRFDFRLRAYSQTAIFAQGSQYDEGAVPEAPFFSAGDVLQHRNFYNPEFDAKLTDYTRWIGDVPGLSILAPDEFKLRAAAWGFYDGLFDYWNPEWNRQRQQRRVRASQTDSAGAIASRTFSDDGKNLREQLAHDVRLNELYFDYTKGPFFLRVGKQAISWGESDSIALLDANNPFDLRMGAPGFFQDTDEARIPLWTVRSTVKLIDNWKFLSSLFADVYMVPGPIDTTVTVVPTWFGQPYSAPGNDPQVANLESRGLGSLLHLVLVDKLPKNEWKETRWGARLTGVLFRDYTVQGWFYRTYQTVPQPLLLGPAGILQASNPANLSLIDNRGIRVNTCLDAAGSPVARAPGAAGRTPAGRRCSWAVPVITQLNRHLESVIGLAGTWYSAMLNGIVRAEAELFLDELAFIPSRNINADVQNPLTNPNGRLRNSIPTADYLRWTIGYDRFFFMRALNPANSFIFSGQFNGQWNLSEDGDQDFRNSTTKVRNDDFLPQAGPNGERMPDTNWEDQKRFDSLFISAALQTDYLHGKLTPRLVGIFDFRGTFGFTATATYRFTDSFLFTATYLAIASDRLVGLGTFRDRDQFQFRLTYQLN
jgi:hypothetical protein